VHAHNKYKRTALKSVFIGADEGMLWKKDIEERY